MPYISSPICKLSVSIFLAGLVGCASRAEVTFISQPEGAIVTQIGTNTSIGLTPITKTYGSDSIHGKDSQGCYLLDGIEARWDSGAITRVSELRLCDGKSGEYYFRILRPVSYPDMQKDVRKANQLRAARAQQQLQNPGNSRPSTRIPDSARPAYGP